MGWLLRAAGSPVEGVTMIFSAGLFSYACYLFSPWYHSQTQTAVSAGLQPTAETLLGVFFFLTTLPGLVAPFIREERRERSLKLATFSIFVSFLFLTILRVAVFGWLPVTWLPMILISLASGYLHVWLKVRRN